MATPVTVPRLGWTMESGVFVEWRKADGDAVRAGEPLFVIEGDKAVEEVAAGGAGVLRVLSPGPSPGQTVAVGAVLAYLLEPGEDLPAAPAAAAAAPGLVAGAKPGRQARPPAPLAALASPPARPGAAASPRAARLARERGIDLRAVTGSGRGGRIRERDVRSALEAGASRAGVDAALSPRRRAIADRLRETQARAVPVTLTATADASVLVALRRSLAKGAGARGVAPPAFHDLFLKLTAGVLVRHPLLCRPGITGSGGTESPPAAHIGLAVDTDGGLLVPVVRDADRKDLAQIAAETRALVERARQGRLRPEEMRGGTFTITNLGMHGIDAFTPVINGAEAAILGVGAVRRQPMVVEVDRIEVRDTVTLSLTFDHCRVDGAPAARFLADLRAAIEKADERLGG